MAVHLQRPFVIQRYLVCLHPPMAMILATGVAALAQRLGPKTGMLLDALLLAGALFAIQGNLRNVLAKPGWAGTASAIARIVRRCPTTRVYADTYWNRPVLNLLPIDNRAVVPFAYAKTASDHGFSLAPSASRTLSATCPTIFWAEHAGSPPADARMLRDNLRSRGFPVAEGRWQRIGHGWIFVTPVP